MSSPIPKTMKAWQHASTAGGLHKNLQLNNSAPLPPSSDSLSSDKTHVRIHTCSLNPVDYKLAEIPYVGQYIVGNPSTPCMDYSGTVVSTARKDLSPGQSVFGRLSNPGKFGVLAEFTVAPKDGCVPVPEGLSAEDAACIGTAGGTAWQCIVPNVGSGQGREGEGKGLRVFINGGSGGTGIFGVQIAKALGCFVVTTCSTGNVELCKGLGADVSVDYRTQDVLRELRGLGGFDLVVDNVGTPSNLYFQAHTFTKPGAKFVQVGAGFGLGSIYSLMSRFLLPSLLGGGKRPFQFLGMQNNYEQFSKLAQWMAEGKVRSVIDERFYMEDKGPVKAFERLKTGRVKGKVIVQVSQG